MRIYIVRHGQTDSNKNRQLMGQRIDESLNKIGIRETEKLSKSLVGEDFDIIFSSPLKRALETAEIINKNFNILIKTDNRLKERDFGSLSGKSWDEIESETSWNAHDDDRAQKYNYSSFGGETVGEVRTRLLSFLENIKKEYKNKKVLIVAHGGIMKLMQNIYKTKEEIFTPKNTELYSFDI